jgi:hypothetical protein
VLGSKAAYTSWGLDGQEPALVAGERPGDPGFGETPPERWGTVGLGDDIETVPTENGDYGRFYAGVAAAITDGAPAPVDPAESVTGLRLIADAHAAATPATSDTSNATSDK